MLLQKIDALTQGVVQRDVEFKTLRLTIEKIKIELTYLRRMRYRRSSEKMDNADLQLELLGAALTPMVPSVDAGAAASDNVSDLDDARKKRNEKSKRPRCASYPITCRVKRSFTPIPRIALAAPAARVCARLARMSL